MPDNERERKRTFDDPITPRATKKPNVSASPEDIIMKSAESVQMLDEILNHPDVANLEAIRMIVTKVKENNVQMGEIATALPRGKSYEEVERHRSLVIAGLPESDEIKPSARQNSDSIAVQSLLDTLEVEAKPVTVYRMGGRTDRNGVPRVRLLKVVMPASTHARHALANSKNLKNNAAYQKVFVRPSLTYQERQEQAALRKTVKELVAMNFKRVHIKKNKVMIGEVEYDPNNPPLPPSPSFQ